MNPDVRLMLNFAECGTAMAHATDIEQAEFVDAFCTELYRVCRHEYGCRKQVDYIMDRLEQRSRKLLGLPEVKT